MLNPWSSALAVVNKLQAHGYEAVIVGGAVRDHLLQRPFNDVDVATEALPEQVKTLFKKTFDVGILHGTILVVDEGEPIEVTTYRTESSYSDFRRPDEVQFVRELKEDLRRRDFTMNAIAMRANGEIVDYFGGMKDLQSGLIKAVGNAEERFTEDALRMLRAARFQAQLGFKLDDETFQALKQSAPLIEHISFERIAVELSKLFLAPFTTDGLTSIVESGLEAYLPGRFYPAAWSSIQIETEEQAWSYFSFLNKDADRLLASYKLSNKVKHYEKAILTLCECETWCEEIIFDYPIEQLLFANQIRMLFGKMFETEDMLCQRKDKLVIQHLNDLAITGKDILQWVERKRGPWIKEQLLAVKRAVLNGEVENEKVRIKEWYDATFNKG